MYVCICKGVTDSAIKSCANNGMRRMRDLRQYLGVASQCGSCAKHIMEILDVVESVGTSESLQKEVRE